MNKRFEERRNERIRKRKLRQRRKRIFKYSTMVFMLALVIFAYGIFSGKGPKDMAIGMESPKIKKNLVNISPKTISKEGYQEELVNFLVTKNDSYIYKRPDDSSEVLDKLSNKVVKAFGLENKWVKIEYDKKICYIKEENLEEIKDKDLYKVVDGILFVNDKYGVDERYINSFSSDAESALKSMLEALERNDLEVKVGSKYRDVDEERKLYESVTNKLDYKPEPGHSEFQTGTSVEIFLPDHDVRLRNRLKDSKAGKWLYDNSYKYGFVLRFPEGKKHITGYNEEGIFKYVGVKKAQFMYNNNLCLEELLNIGKKGD